MPEDNENNEQQPEKKSSKLKFIIIGVVALILIILILVVVYSLVLAPKNNQAAPQDQQAQAGAQPQAPVQAQAPMQQQQQQQLAPLPSMDMGMSNTEIGQIYPLPTMNLNLSDPTGITYLAITLALEFDPKNAELLTEIEAKMPRIQDMIITVLSSKAYEEISTAQGKVNLRNEFMRRINAMMAKGKLYNIYITGFTVQRQ